MTKYTLYSSLPFLKSRTSWLWMLVLACCMYSNVGEAQDIFDVKVMLRKKNKATDGTIKLDTIDKGVAHLFFNQIEAENCRNGKKFVSNSYVFIDELDKTWKIDRVQGGASYIVVLPENGIDKIPPHMFEIQQGKTFYSYDYPVDAGGGIIIDGVIIKENRKVRKKDITPGPPWEDGDKITWEILSILDRSYLKKNSRFMFVPKAFEYRTDRMVQNIPPAVYDTEDYMRAQVRRKSFDYETNDSLVQYVLYEDRSKQKGADSLAVDSTLILNDSEFICKYKFVFKMPDVNKFYYYRGVRELEDYSHVYFADTVRSSHLRKKPWRFLVTNFAVQYGDLADSLYQTPKVQVSNEPRQLALVFKNNSAQLDDNVKNDSIKSMIKNDLHLYRNSLMQVEVNGSASPEGSLEHNIELANRRADYAVSLIRQYSPGVNVVRGQPMVHEWTAVIDTLKKIGRLDIADAIESRLASGGKVTKDMPEWNETIEPILSEFRSMNCSYIIRLNKPLDPDQAVNAFLHDPDYAEGGTKDFSQGDYFNIYKYAHTYCSDSLRVEKALADLSERIYREKIAPNRNNAVRIPFYAYVANRHLADKLKSSTIDGKSPGILAGFVNLDTLRGGHLDSQINGLAPTKGRMARTYRINRSDHVANLALAYFQLKKYSLADTLSQILPQNPEYDHMYKAVRMLTLLCSRFLSKPEEAEEGLEYAWNASPLSRAVLAVELRERLGEDRQMSNDSIKNLLWTLPEDEPRKWYLMGLVTLKDAASYGMYGNPHAAPLKKAKEKMDKMENENSSRLQALFNDPEYKRLEAEIDSLQRLSDAAGKPSLKDSVPDYCAYLQHAFDLDSNYYHIHYMMDYDFDQHVRDVKQSKQKGIKPSDYQYIRKLAPEYRAHFNDIMNYMKDVMAKKKEENAFKSGGTVSSPAKTETPAETPKTDMEEADQTSEQMEQEGAGS